MDHSSDRADQASKLEAAAKQQAEAQEHIAHLQRCIELYQNECRTLQRSYMDKRRELCELQRHLEHLNQYTKDLKLRHQQSEQRNADLLDQLGNAQAVQADMSAAINGYAEQIKTLEQIRQGLEEKLQTVQGENQCLQAQQAAYMPVAWATWLIPIWRSYYYEHYHEIEEKKDALKRGMDQESVQLLELLCLRNFEILPPIRDAEKFLYRIDGIYEPWELEGMAHTEHKEIFKQRHILPENCYLETTVSKFYNGLALLPEKIQARLKGAHIIDGGAYWGDSMLAFSEHHPKAIHCFEPNTSNFKRLQETVSLNHLEKMAVLNQLGLSLGTGDTELYSCEFPSCSAIMLTGMQNLGIHGEESIHVIGIDEYVKQKNIKVGMIKLDVEGVEFDAISGARECIVRDRPILLISIYHTPRDFFDIKPMIESWGLNYHFMIRKTTYRDPIAEVMLIGYVEGSEGGKQ